MRLIEIPRQYHRWPRALFMAIAGVLAIKTACAAGPYAYVPSYFDNTFSAVDLSNTAAMVMTYTVTGTASSTGFYGAALDAKNGKLYISDDYNQSVFVVDTATGATLLSYHVGINPRGIAVDQSGKHVYVADFGSSGIKIIDIATGSVNEVDFSSLPGAAVADPLGVALNLSGTRAYVTDTSVGHRMCRINTLSPPSQVAESDCLVMGAEDNDSDNPTALAVSPDARRVYVVNHGENSVSVVDTANFTVLRTFALGYASPNGIAISSSGKRAYVGTTPGKIVVLDLTRVDDASQDVVMDVISDDAIATVQGVSISPDGTRLLAVDNTASQLHFIDIEADHDVRVDSVDINEGPYSLGQFTATDPIFVGGFE